MKIRLPYLVTVGCFLLCGLSMPINADPIDMFMQRVNQRKIRFTFIDPNDLGNPHAPPVDLAQVEDTNGTLGEISLNSPGWLRWVGKGLCVVGGTVGGALGGAAVGSAVPVLGTTAGAIYGGVAGAASTVGAAIVANTDKSNANLTQDISVFDQIIIETAGGDVDLAAAIITGVLNDPGVITHDLPGGGTLLQPSPSLFAGSKIIDHYGVELPDGEVEIGVIDADGNLVTTLDQTVAIFFQDLVRGIQLTDDVAVFIDNVVSPGLLEDGDPVRSRSMFVQTMQAPPIPTLTNWGLLVLFLLLVASAIYVIYQRRRGVVPR